MRHDDPPAASPNPTGFVGRTAELALLRGALRDAQAGHGGAVLIGGEAGIGKTRLLTEFAELARDGGALLLAGRCLDLVGPGVPYLAVMDALHQVRGASPLVSRIDDPEAVRLWLFAEIRSLLDRLAADTPVVLALEDLHWADASTLDLVSYLAHTSREAGILVVGTFRDDEPVADGALTRWVSDLARARLATVLELAPLSRDELRRVLETSSASAMPADLVDVIHRRSRGNPFYAQELLAASARGEGALPRGLRHALLSRLAGLDPAGEELVRVAAAAGGETTFRFLATITSLAEPVLDAGLRAVLDRRILVHDPEAGRLRFRHALLAEAAYGALPPGARERLHTRIAQTLDDAAAHGLPRPTPAELAEHWAIAGRPTEALAASVKAAQAAEADSGLAEALRHLERALELWSRVPHAEQLAGMGQPEAMARAAELADLTGQGQMAAQLARQAIDLLGETDPARTGALFERLGTYLLPIGDRQAGLAAFRRAVELTAPDPPNSAHARALAGLGNALMLSWEHRESREVCAHAVEVARAAGDTPAEVRALSVLGIDLSYLGDLESGMARLREAHRQAREAGLARELTHNYVLLCDVLVSAGRWAEAGRTAAEGLAYARGAGLERGYGVVLAGYAAEAHLETGEWAAADEMLDTALRPGAEYWTHYPRLLRAELAVARGDTEAARRHLAAGSRGATEPTSSPRYARVAAELALWQHRPDAACDALARVDAAQARVQGPRLYALRLRATADAGRGLDDATAPPDSGSALAAAWHAVAQGELSRLRRRPDPAAWQRAAAAWDALGHPYQGAYSRWRWAESLLAVGGPAAEAGVRLREAHRVAGRLGAAPLRTELQRLAQRFRLDLVGLTPDRDERLADVLGLTRRECQVLTLLTRGYTNREIAAELTMSPKTASVHVTHILRKLDVSTRQEAAAVVHHLDTAPPGR